MKDIAVLEINSKKTLFRKAETLGNVEVQVPNEFLLINNTDSILNNKIFKDYIDYIFMLITEEFMQKFDKKIDNVYVTFLNDDNEFICSIVIDKINVKNQAYRIGVMDWQASDYIFKYSEE